MHAADAASFTQPWGSAAARCRGGCVVRVANSDDSAAGRYRVVVRGLMVGVELSSPCAGLVKQALDQGLLINVTAERVVRLLPPLIISRQEVDALLDILCPLILQWPAQSDAA